MTRARRETQRNKRILLKKINPHRFPEKETATFTNDSNIFFFSRQSQESGLGQFAGFKFYLAFPVPARLISVSVLCHDFRLICPPWRTVGSDRNVIHNLKRPVDF